MNVKRSDGFLTAVLTDAFTVKPATAVPVVQHINPSTVKAGTKAFILTVTGENFAKGNRVRWKGVARGAVSQTPNYQIEAIYIDI